MSCGVGHRSSSDPVLLWRRLAAVTLIRPLAWELPYALGVALKKKKKKKSGDFVATTLFLLSHVILGKLLTFSMP